MQTWGFWAVAAVMCAAVAASLIATLLQRRAALAPAAGFDLQVYRDQLAGLERDLASGVVSAAEGERLRTEISRRILEADRQVQAAGAVPEGRVPVWLVGGLIGLVLVASLGLYAWLGAPGYPDLPLAGRLAASDAYLATRAPQAEVEAKVALPAPLEPDADYAVLMGKLRQAVKDRPGDVQGLELLARNEAALGNLGAARDAQVALIAAKAAAATGGDHATLAELLIGLAGGYVSPEAEAELIRALELEPGNGLALYYSGLMFAQGDRADRAFQIWQGLLETSAPDAPWVAGIRAGIEEMAARAGVHFALPEAAGPSAAEVDAAADMTEEDRRAMIEGMVDGLSDRLANGGGPVEDWARLITSLGVLGDVPRAKAAYAEAQGRFAGREAELTALRAAAEAAGVAE